MPEGDTVRRTATRLDQALRGQILRRAELRWGDLGGIDLTGRRTLEVVSRGKHLLNRLDDGWTLHSHLRMEGSWRIAATDTSTGGRRIGGPHVRAVLATDAWTCLGVRLGRLDLVPSDREGDLVGHLGPDLLGDDWDADRAVANIRHHPTDPIGYALMDQRSLAGIGTVFAAESLFVEGVHPWTPVGDLDDDGLTGIVHRAHRLLRIGATRPIRCSTGIPRPGRNLFVHARSGRDCRRCGGIVRVATIGVPPSERAFFYCPTCQGGLAPGDHGRALGPLGRNGR